MQHYHSHAPDAPTKCSTSRTSSFRRSALASGPKRARTRSYSGALGTVTISARPEGGHYMFIEAVTDQTGESRLDRNVKRFFVQRTSRGRSGPPSRSVRTDRWPTRTVSRAPSRPSDALTLEQKVELYYWMRLTRSLEERLVNLYRQTKVVGGLFRSLGQEADAVGSAFALDRSDGRHPVARSFATSARCSCRAREPLEIIRQYMAKGDSPTRGRELNIHFGDIVRGFVGQISHLGDMVPVMAGVTLVLQDARREARRSGLRRRWRDVAPARSTRESTSPRCSAARSS